ncbi:MAG: hypothetical protein MJH11_19635 [Lentisphaeria bacterium]|nr:hypothetical protein [Lentisphaeria bacterium]
MEQNHNPDDLLKGFKKLNIFVVGFFISVILHVTIIFGSSASYLELCKKHGTINPADIDAKEKKIRIKKQKEDRAKEKARKEKIIEEEEKKVADLKAKEEEKERKNK